MPIKNLTDRGAMLPPLAVIRKGDPKPNEKQPGKDRKSFRFDTQDDNARSLFREKYGDEPTEINVYLMYPTTDQNFECWQEAWTASSLQHRCDGERCVLWREGSQIVRADDRKDAKPCPSPQQPERDRCKPVGRLNVIIPELRRFARVTVLTTSKHDILHIAEQLRAIELLHGDLAGVPFILSRRVESISTPRDGNKRVRTKKSLLNIEVHPAWGKLKLAAMRHEARPQLPPAPNEAPNGDHEEELIEAEWSEVEESTMPGFASESAPAEPERKAIAEVAAEDGQIVAIKRLCEARKQDPDAVCREFAGAGLSDIGPIAAGELITELQRPKNGNGIAKPGQAVEAKPEPQAKKDEPPPDRETTIKRIHGVVEDLYAVGVTQKQIDMLAKKYNAMNLAKDEARLNDYLDALKMLKGAAEQQVPAGASA